jgi:hypothetical protein
MARSLSSGMLRATSPLDERGERANDLSGLITYDCSLLQSRVEREKCAGLSRRQGRVAVVRRSQVRFSVSTPRANRGLGGRARPETRGRISLG